MKLWCWFPMGILSDTRLGCEIQIQIWINLAAFHIDRLRFLFRSKNSNCHIKQKYKAAVLSFKSTLVGSFISHRVHSLQLSLISCHAWAENMSSTNSIWSGIVATYCTQPKRLLMILQQGNVFGNVQWSELTGRVGSLCEAAMRTRFACEAHPLKEVKRLIRVPDFAICKIKMWSAVLQVLIDSEGVTSRTHHWWNLFFQCIKNRTEENIAHVLGTLLGEPSTVNSLLQPWWCVLQCSGVDVKSCVRKPFWYGKHNCASQPQIFLLIDFSV